MYVQGLYYGRIIELGGVCTTLCCTQSVMLISLPRYRLLILSRSEGKQYRLDNPIVPFVPPPGNENSTYLRRLAAADGDRTEALHTAPAPKIRPGRLDMRTQSVFLDLSWSDTKHWTNSVGQTSFTSKYPLEFYPENNVISKPRKAVVTGVELGIF